MEILFLLHIQLQNLIGKDYINKYLRTKENTIGELLERLEEEIKNPKDSVHQIVLQTTIDNINKLIDNSL